METDNLDVLKYYDEWMKGDKKMSLEKFVKMKTFKLFDDFDFESLFGGEK